MVLPMYISYAAMDGKVSEIADWIERPGVTRDLNDPDEDGWTALSRATRRNQCAVIELLLSRGADVRVGEAHGWTPLHHAALKGHAAAAALLLEAGAVVDAKFGHPATSPLTSLLYAAANGHRAVVTLLLKHGAALPGADVLERARATEEDHRGARVATAVAAARAASDDAEAERLEAEEAAVAERRRADYPGTDALVAAVRAGGGTWGGYLRFPRQRLLSLHVLCARGRAWTDDALLRRLFPWRPAAAQPRRSRARARAPGRELPKEVLWLVLTYWCSSRDLESYII